MGYPHPAFPFHIDKYDDFVKVIGEFGGLKRQGVAAGVYTQTSDVEGEVNGLMTYDRKVIKIPAEELRELHKQLFR